MQISELAAICEPSKLIRENWYSETYAVQTKLTQDTEPVITHITHITTPFSKEKEAIAAHMFHLDKEDMQKFYEWIWACIKNHVQKLRTLNKKGIQGAIQLFKADTQLSDNGVRDIYLLTAPYEKAETMFISKSEITLNEIINLAIRLGNIVRDISAEGVEITHGNMSMDALYVGQDGRIYVGDWYFTSTKGNKKEPLYKYGVFPHVPKTTLKRTVGPTTQTDIYAVASIIWNLLSEIPVDEYYPYRMIPHKAPTKLLEALKFGLKAEDNDLPLFRKQLSEIKRDAAKDEVLGKLTFKLNVEKPYTWKTKPPEKQKITTETILDTLNVITTTT